MNIVRLIVHINLLGSDSDWVLWTALLQKNIEIMFCEELQFCKERANNMSADAGADSGGFGSSGSNSTSCAVSVSPTVSELMREDDSDVFPPSPDDSDVLGKHLQADENDVFRLRAIHQCLNCFSVRPNEVVPGEVAKRWARGRGMFCYDLRE
jgi:hypothetical protein